MKKKNKEIFYKLVFVALFATIALCYNEFSPIELNNGKYFEETNETIIRISGSWNLSGSSIYIDDSNPSNNWSYTALNYDWCSGSGSWNDPYIIENVTIDDPPTDNCLDIKNSDVYFIIRNCSLRNTNGAGMNLRETSNGFILNNSISSCSYGIRLYKNSNNNNTLIGNLIKDNSNGINVEDSNRNNILGNIFEYCSGQEAIRLDNSNHSIISGNIIKNPLWHGGFGVVWGKNNIISENNLYNAPIEVSGYNNTILKNTIKNVGLVGGIYQNGENSTVSENTIYISDSGYSGIGISGANSTFSKNKLYGCGINLIAKEHSNSIDTLNLVNDKPVYYYVNSVGLKPTDFVNAGQVILVNCNDSLVSNLNISNTKTGIELYYCNNNSLQFNNITYNYAGIRMGKSNNNSVSENNINYNRDGLSVSGNRNKIIKNNISDQLGSGVSGTFSNGSISENFINRNGIGAMTSGDYVLISNNTLNNNSFCGLQIGSSYNTVINNTMKYNSITGIFGGGRFNNISANIVSFNKKDGIRSFGRNNTFSDNLVNNNNESGIFVKYQNNHTFTGNILKNNGLYGVSLYTDEYHGGSTIKFSNNELINCGFELRKAGLEAMLPHKTSIIDTSNLVNGKPLYYYFNQSDLRKDDFLGAGQIILINCSSIVIADENVSNGSTGISLYHCTNTTILRTIANDNIFNGVYLYNSNFNNLTYNTVNNNGGYGIYGHHCNDSVFLENDVRFNQQGIHISYANNNTFKANTILDNIIYGVFVHGTCNNNLFYGNIFNNPLALNALNNAPNTSWDNGSIGNYWHDYDGYDIDGDNIGETPYISGNIIDNFPICYSLDTFSPIITILSPSENDVFGEDSPEFSITIEDLLDFTWYTLDGGNINITFINGVVQVNQTLWNSLSEGTLELRIYAKDLAGNTGYSFVNIVKYTTTPSTEPDMLPILIGVIGGVSLLAVVVIFLVRKRFKRE